MLSILPLVQARLVFVTGLPVERVNAWLGDAESPHLQGDQDLVIRLQGFTPDAPWFVGGGRYTPRVTERLEVQLRTRLALDQTGSAYIWLTDAVSGHLELRYKVVNALLEYTPTDADANALVTDPLAMVPSRPPKPDSKSGAAVNWGFETITFEVNYLFAVDLTLDLTTTE